MTAALKYEFRKVNLDDLPMLLGWQGQSHLRKWWDSDEPYDQEELRNPLVSRWIVSVEGRPFAFMQDYSIHGGGDYHFADLPMGARGIDQYVGDPMMIGVGHGTAFIGARMRVLIDGGHQ